MNTAEYSPRCCPNNSLSTACRGLTRTTSKIGVITVEDISKSVHAIILAGGSADNPLARYRAMPAVELGEWPGHSHLVIGTAAKYLGGAVTVRHYGQVQSLEQRSVPVSAGSSTQLIDISISNCIRSGVNKLCAPHPHPFCKSLRQSLSCNPLLAAQPLGCLPCCSTLLHGAGMC